MGFWALAAAEATVAEKAAAAGAAVLRAGRAKPSTTPRRRGLAVTWAGFGTGVFGDLTEAEGLEIFAAFGEAEATASSIAETAIEVGEGVVILI
jgi:hypothetical protein